MKLDDLASLMNISKDELIEELKQNDIIELKLNDKPNKEIKDYGSIEVLE